MRKESPMVMRMSWNRLARRARMGRHSTNSMATVRTAVKTSPTAAAARNGSPAELIQNAM